MTFVTTYKQADLTLTGTMRKAQLAATATKTSRRQNHPTHSGSPAPSMSDQFKRRASEISTMSQLLQAEEKIKQCEKCHVKYSPIWWPIDHMQESDERNKLLCHKCNWGIIHAKSVVNGDGSASGKETSLTNGIEGVQDPRVGIAV